MTVTIAYLGPEGTYSQLAALAYGIELEHQSGQPVDLRAFPSIPRAMQATAAGDTTLAVVPAENSIEGGVTFTLDTLWVLNQLKIHQALVMPIRHGLLSQARSLAELRVVYSHPQALSQCQLWLEQQVPQAMLVATNSTTEPLGHLVDDRTVGAVSSEWAAQLHNLPVLAHDINDQPDNCTKFWVLGLGNASHQRGSAAYTSLAFSVPVNAPGALLKPLQVFAHHGINLSRIESRPAKRSLGDYRFFVDLEASTSEPRGRQALQELTSVTETLIQFGSYNLVTISHSLAAAKAKYAELKTQAEATP
ncbi:MAG: prephenate dehydratase [Nodosilinea sp.]